MPKVCNYCEVKNAVLKRPKTGALICKECFYEQFELEIHHTIVQNKLFKRGDRVAIAASGGKDSTVLAHTMTLLNKRFDYGLDLFLLSIDEGISGYRDDSLETVKRNKQQYEVPLTIVSYKDLYGWTMDEIVQQIGRTNNCTFCGVFRRQALDRGATFCKADKIVTGHNADDIAETVLMNILRGDFARLTRCVAITTGKDGSLPRCKPFKYTYEKEIVMYAYYKSLDYFSTECIYSPFAFRGHSREFLKDLERTNSASIIDIIRSAEHFHANTQTRMPKLGSCQKCGYLTSAKICKACVLLAGLNKGQAKLAVGRAGNRLRKEMALEKDGGDVQMDAEGKITDRNIAGASVTLPHIEVPLSSTPSTATADRERGNGNNTNAHTNTNNKANQHVDTKTADHNNDNTHTNHNNSSHGDNDMNTTAPPTTKEDPSPASNAKHPKRFKPWPGSTDAPVPGQSAARPSDLSW